MEYKIVIGAKDGKSYQKEIKDAEADALHNKYLGDTVSGDSLGYRGYEFLITGGSDKSGFPMRKGIQAPRKKVMVGKSVGCCGKDRNNKKRKGLFTKKTVCGERITKIIRQVNLKVVKEGPQPLGGAPGEGTAAEAGEKA
ncbi:MAG: S6e family ribosomal protein [Nanoarchaeota archaeon]